MNRITCRAVQVMVDMMRDLMERVMDEAATCADSNGRVTIDSGNINAGARLAMHNSIDAHGGGCPGIKMSMLTFASQRYTKYQDYLWWGSRRKQRQLRVEPSLSPPTLPIGPGQHRYCFDPFRIASYLITWNT